MKKLAIVLIMLILIGCSPATNAQKNQTVAPPPPTQPQITHTPLPSSTFTATTAPTDTPAPTATSTPLSGELRDQILQTYKVMLFIQIDTNLLKETATRVQSGELSGFESFGALLTVTALVAAVNDAIPNLSIPDLMQPYWERARSVHDETRDILARWINDDIDSKIVLQEITEPIKDIDDTLSNAEEELSIIYGFDARELEQARSDTIDSISEVFSTPTPFPEGAGAPLEVLSSEGYEDGNWYNIIGEVKNNSDEPMEFVKIIATLYDDNEQVVGTSTTYTSLDVIPPNEKAPFEISTDEWQGTTHYKIQVQGRPGVLSQSDLEIPSHQSYTDGNWYNIIGEVKNNSDQPMEFVKVIATLYDGENQVVGTNTTYTILDVIPAGGKAPFEISIDHWEGATHYEVKVQGREGELSLQDLVIDSHKISTDGNWLTIQGEVKNTGSESAEFVKVVATLYDADSNVVGVISTYTSLDKIASNESSPFEGSTNYWPDYDYYEIQVQGR